MILLKNLWPVLFLAGLFVCAVYLAKYIIARFLEHK
ncbi:hypothetical protein C8C89_1762 [Janthinobacterium sp. 75]|nr:hypothetical protein C8C89_1762 [Janthinobacterium sp. 75]